MTPDEKAKELGIDLASYTPIPNLAAATRVGNTIYTSGHVSSGHKGRLGEDLNTDQGKEAAKVCGIQVLLAAYQVTGTLNNLRCIKVLGAVNSAPGFTDQHLVMNGASQVIWDVLGKEGRGYHARSALGFVSLPLGFAVEVEAIFEVIEDEPIGL